jgi:hypothetical protein
MYISVGLLKQFRYTNSEVKPKKASDDLNPELLSRFLLTCCTYPRSDMLLQLQGEVRIAFTTCFLVLLHKLFVRMRCTLDSGQKALKGVESSGAGEHLILILLFT